MTNAKEPTTYLTMVGMALLVMVLSMLSSSTQTIALGHWNPDEDYTLNGGIEGDGAGSSGTIDMIKIGDKDMTTEIENQGSDNNSDNWKGSESVSYEVFQRCLSDAEGEDGFHTQQEMRVCYESNLGEDSTQYIPIEDDGDGSAYENGMKQDDDSTDDTQDEE